MKVLVVFGTRPEAIKLAPVIRRLKARPDIECRVCVTAQHRQMLDQALDIFEIVPDRDLNLMQAGQQLADITSWVLTGLDPIIASERPDYVMVHGDTTTSFAASLVAFYHRVPIAHVEAGLRSGSNYAPWPEEANRRLTAVLASLHFAPTLRAREALLREGVPAAQIEVTGNTVVDALIYAVSAVRKSGLFERRFKFLDGSRRIVLVTGHRRESFGEGFMGICEALTRLAESRDVQIVYPVHMNPNVRSTVMSLLDKRDRVFLIDPLDYLEFVALMDRAHMILTDSGGIQEEAPGLGKPVLVLRETTERTEGVESGCSILVGVDPARILSEAQRLLDDEEHYRAMAKARNPFGDGRAAERIVARLASSTK